MAYVTRQWPEVSDFVRRFCTLCESKNIQPCENSVLFSHGRRFFDLLNVQKSVTQIKHLRPLPICYNRLNFFWYNMGYITEKHYITCYVTYVIMDWIMYYMLCRYKQV